MPQVDQDKFPNVKVHESAYVDEPCEIGEGTSIWHFSHIMANCTIGDGCNIGQNVVVSPDVIIGNNVKIQNNVSLYTGVVLEDDVFCGPSMVFTNVINPRSEIVRRGEYQRTLIKKGASMGANCTIVCGSTVGRFAFIAAGAVVSKDVPDYALLLTEQSPLHLPSVQFHSKYSNLSNLTFAPKVLKSEVQSVLSLCDLVYFSVHVSKVWMFGQSLNKIIDYMVSGKPVLASYTGYPSMINESDCGSFVAAGDVAALQDGVLLYFNMNPEELTSIGMRGRSWLVENRPYKKLAGNYLEILFP